ncbi:hypothetical protein CFP65_1003 [Kitasatospora sp. MMS16-BH015]|uniref:DUF4232 domain-containing protein n=1 Tax=Kitasatospora sp. MMS16-BH015 TaxID=2018025 RepID=UPI000CA2D35C|nr:DUF4232 domain-containing protein [Kitasatospora sp. MMS16-BH015]AUG75921.1 hypothetical protein CFP65_1003 [Kitasatospora sp. MMS16-BH015]
MRSRLYLSLSAAALLLAAPALTACSSSADSTPKAAAPAAAAPSSGAPAAAAPGAAAAPVSAGPVAAAAPSAGAAGTGAQTAKCTSAHLKWTVTRITNPAADTPNPPNGRLTVTNTGSQSCTFTGYPKLAFHLGKGPEADGVGKGDPAPLTLAAGRQAVIDLSYSELNGKGPDSANCVLTTTGSAQVTAPGETTEVRVPVTDQSGKPTDITICGDTVRMGTPTTH